jgi:GTPase KRas
VYSITDSKSFQEVVKTIETVLRLKNENHFPMVLVGTKCDLENERKVTFEEGSALSNKYGIPFFETSAKKEINVDESMFSLVDEVLKKKVSPPSKDGSSSCLMM